MSMTKTYISARVPKEILEILDEKVQKNNEERPYEKLTRSKLIEKIIISYCL